MFHLFKHGSQRTEFDIVNRNTFLRIELDTIWSNIKTLYSKCGRNTEIIAVIKGNAYGHGSVMVARYLFNCGIHNFAVATVFEGKELRENGIKGFIQVFGNCVVGEIGSMIKYNLTPTVSSLKFLVEWARQVKIVTLSTSAVHYEDLDSADTINSKNHVVIKVDSGMSRNGCQCEDLPEFIKRCEQHSIVVHSIMTHFAQAWDDASFTKQQIDRFLKATHAFRQLGFKIHAANSSAIIKGYGADFDFVRPGIAIYGLPPDSTDETATLMQTMGFRPALSWVAKPSLIKTLSKDRKVGYDQTYKLIKEEKIATFSFGYADGFNRLLSNKGTITDSLGKEYPVVGRISMDSITVKVDDSITEDSVFYVLRDDYFSINSARKIAYILDTIPYEIGTILANRLPRLYVTSAMQWLSKI